MGKIADQLQQALTSKSNIKTELVAKGMSSMTPFESYYTFIRTLAGSSSYYVWVTKHTEGGDVSGSGQYFANDVITIQAQADSGYEFDHWSVASGETSRLGSTTNPLTTFSVIGADIIFAHFRQTGPTPPQPTRYTVTLNTTNGGTVSGGGEFDAGTTIQISATANSGYHFVEWSDGDTQASRQITVNSNITLTAKFEQDTPQPATYTITTIANPTNGGTISGGGQHSTSEGLITISATPASGYHFVQWEDGSTLASRTVPQVNGTYTATFAQDLIHITVTSSASSGGSVSGGGDYVVGATATISASANSHAEFGKWNDGDTTNPRQIPITTTMTSTTFRADWKYKQEVATNNPWGTATCDGGSEVYKYPGEQVSLVATADSNHVFYVWDDGDTNATRTYSAIASSGVIIKTAIFASEITFDSDGGSAVSPMYLTTVDTITPPTPTKSGYTFDYWMFSDGTIFTNQTFSQNTTLVAHWTPLQTYYYYTSDTNPSSPMSLSDFTPFTSTSLQLGANVVRKNMIVLLPQTNIVEYSYISGGMQTILNENDYPDPYDFPTPTVTDIPNGYKIKRNKYIGGSTLTTTSAEIKIL